MNEGEFQAMLTVAVRPGASEVGAADCPAEGLVFDADYWEFDGLTEEDGRLPMLKSNVGDHSCGG